MTSFHTNHGIECLGFRIAQMSSVAVFTVDARPALGRWPFVAQVL